MTNDHTIEFRFDACSLLAAKFKESLGVVSLIYISLYDLIQINANEHSNRPQNGAGPIKVNCNPRSPNYLSRSACTACVGPCLAV